MDLTDILLIAILAAVLRPQLINSDWMQSKRRNTRRRFRRWKESRAKDE